jgi:hypothetical protein
MKLPPPTSRIVCPTTLGSTKILAGGATGIGVGDGVGVAVGVGVTVGADIAVGTAVGVAGAAHAASNRMILNRQTLLSTGHNLSLRTIETTFGYRSDGISLVAPDVKSRIRLPATLP